MLSDEMSPLKKLFAWVAEWNWSAFGHAFWLAALAGFLLIAVPGARPDLQSESFQALGIARDHLFNFAQWETEALLDKAGNGAVGSQRYMTEEERTAYVRDYLELVAEIDELEDRVSQVYIDPTVDDPEAATADLRAHRDALRVEQQRRQALAESIVQAQISDVLVEYGFGRFGEVFPPVAIRFTRLPTILIISHRDVIERTGAYPLEHGLTVDQMERIEDGVDDELDVSSLIVPLGGLAVWPAMQIETGYLPFVFEVGAHEWTHHYLAFYPLGFNYGATPDLYTINETVAGIVENEIGWAVLNKYYPDLAPPPPDYTPRPEPIAPPPSESAEPPPFDFRAEMHETRVQADALLAAGQIDEAEAYMEVRRRIFVEHGYQIRKINQAYFAFYGSYADEPGATGSNPIGPALRELRFYSPSLVDFIDSVRGVTTFEEIQHALEAARAARS
jgi:hypothetical protein